MKSKIEYKLLPIMVLAIILMGVLFGALFSQSQQATLDDLHLRDIQSAKRSFDSLEQNDIKMLKAAMTDIMTNKEILALFKEGLASGNNSNLYAATKDLYAAHKAMGITHFYFETLDSKVFLRVHQPSNSGDTLGRATYLKAKETGSWGSGIEMGKTAFALRVVAPYKDGDATIGYLEYGEEIDHFLRIMHEQTGDDFAMVVKKDFVKEADWATLTTNKNVRNNYGDYERYVLIDSTNPERMGTRCWNEADLDSTTTEGNIYATVTDGESEYLCGGFALIDAKGTNVGSIVVLKDVTAQQAASAAVLRNVILLTILTVIILGLLVMYITKRAVVKPIVALTQAANKIADGDLDATFPEIKTNDEIQALAETMSMMAGAAKIMRTQLQEKGTEKKKR
jgi:HAMP domain-containing protein